MDQVTPSSCVKKGCKRSVRFNDAIDVCQIPSLNQYSSREIEKTWYSALDLAKMIPSEKQMKKLSKNCANDCIRGLESKHGTSLEERIVASVHSVMAVLEEQHIQRRTGTHLPNRLSQAYSRYSQRCINEAHILGLIDEKYAMEEVYALPCSDRSVKLSEEPLWNCLSSCTCRQAALKKAAKDAKNDQTVPPKKPSFKKIVRKLMLTSYIKKVMAAETSAVVVPPVP